MKYIIVYIIAFLTPFILIQIGITEGVLGSIICCLIVAWLLSPKHDSSITEDIMHPECLNVAALRRLEAGLPVFVDPKSGKWYPSPQACRRQLGEISIYSISKKYPLFKVEKM